MATKKAGGDDYTLATCERVRIEKGQQYFEVEIVGDEVNSLLVGVVSAGIGTEERSGKNFAFSGEKRAWLMYMYSGSLYGNGKQVSDYAGPLRKGDRLGVLVDHDEGSVGFLVNGKQHGPGWGKGSLSGPVVPAVQMCGAGHSVRLVPVGSQ